MIALRIVNVNVNVLSRFSFSFALLNIDFAWHFVDNAIEKVLALKLHIKVARWFAFDAYFNIRERKSLLK